MLLTPTYPRIKRNFGSSLLFMDSLVVTQHGCEQPCPPSDGHEGLATAQVGCLRWHLLSSWGPPVPLTAGKWSSLLYSSRPSLDRPHFASL